MKGIKIYLYIALFLIVSALGIGVYVWHILQSLNSDASKIDSTIIRPIVEVKQSARDEEYIDLHTETQMQIQTEAPVTNPITVEVERLPSDQQNILRNLGFSQEAFVLTAEMIICAENTIGKDRLDEFAHGAAPTPFESLRLLPCFKK